MQGKIETCKRCGRKLKTAKSIELGFGRVCYKKYLDEQAEIGFMDNQMSMEDMARTETFEVKINGEWKKANLFQVGDRVKNENELVGTVVSTEEGGLLVNVDWDESGKAGQKWLATSLAYEEVAE